MLPGNFKCVSGLDSYNISNRGGDVLESTSFDITAGIIYNKFVTRSITPNTTIPILYKSVSDVWIRYINTDQKVHYTASGIVYGADILVPENNGLLYHYFATLDRDYPIMAILPTELYTGAISIRCFNARKIPICRK